MIVQNQNPAANSLDNDTFQPVVFELYDAAGTDSASVIIWVDGHIVWQGDTDYPTDSYAVTKTVITGGYRYSIAKDLYWTPRSQLVIKVYAQNVGNTAQVNQQWWFRYGRSRILVFDGFDGSLPAILPGNLSTGLFSIASSRLHVEMPSGSNGYWWTGSRNGNMPYYPFTLDKTSYGNYTFETLMTSFFTANSSQTQVWFGVYQDVNNWYIIETNDGTTMYSGKMIAGTWTQTGSVSAATPRQLRIVLDLKLNLVYWQYYTGATWVDIGASQAIQITPSLCFLYSNNWGALPRVYAEYEYLKISAELNKSGVDWTLAPRTWRDSLADLNVWPRATGQAHHTAPNVSEGIRSAGAPRQPLATPVVGPDDRTWPLDKEAFPKHTGLIRPTYPPTGAAIQLPSHHRFVQGRIGPDAKVSGQKDVERFIGGTPLSIGAGKRLPRTHRWWVTPYHGYPDHPTVNVTSGIGRTSWPIDEKRLVLGAPPTYRQNTYDSEAHPHFIDRKVKRCFVYDRTGEPWSNPGSNNLTGYGADGFQYLNGVRTGGQAPWATEIANADRSSRFPFPVKTLTVISYSEIVVFDLDNYPATLDVWIRFRGLSTYSMIGYGADSLEDVKWCNGVLVVGSAYSGSTNGGLFAIDFKSLDQSCAMLIRNDGHWWWGSGKTIKDRNTASNLWTATGAGSANRIESTSVYHVAASYDKRQVGSNWRRQWLCAYGENPLTVIETLGNVPQYDYNATGTLAKTYNYSTRARLPFFDKAGWLWFSVENYLFRNVSDYQTGVIIGDAENDTDILVNNRTSAYRSDRTRMRAGYVKLADNILWLDDIGDYIFAGTTAGVYMINRYTLDSWLAFTISGGGGMGGTKVAHAGEVAVGRSSLGRHVHCVGTPYAQFVEWANGLYALGGGNLVRFSNNFALGQYVYPALAEDGAYFAVSVLVG